MSFIFSSFFYHDFSGGSLFLYSLIDEGRCIYYIPTVALFWSHFNWAS